MGSLNHQWKFPDFIKNMLFVKGQRGFATDGDSDGTNGVCHRCVTNLIVPIGGKIRVVQISSADVETYGISGGKDAH